MTGRARAGGLRAALAASLVLLCGCVQQAPPAPATLRTMPPPWPAPRDGISYFELAGVPSSRLDDRTGQRVITVSVRIDGSDVPLVPNIGLDLPRALQAPAHTHDASGTVWLEGAGAASVTLGQFFTLWGVRFDGRCLGAACGQVTVTADGVAVDAPAALVLSSASDVQIRLASGG
ncbi:MAG TPA: hypothetical protein VGK18_07625 [Propionicimonas sp.]|jgi:hypothetical protein|uniref:hypothetical protein n=1 Tax=Propionicimonas sp. TaxID=1955623 RepID=UPI002F404495